MVKDTLQKQLHKARPKLKMVSPMAYWTVMVMAIFNLLLGASLFLLVDETRLSASLIIVNDFLTYKFWGAVFIAIGFIKVYSLLSNDWNLARKSLIIGVAVKAAWSVALIVRVLVSPGTFFLTLLWVTVAMLQMGAYIWFLPHGFVGNGKKD
jgi:hypothetical protein